jgi:hypothetical protein
MYRSRKDDQYGAPPMYKLKKDGQAATPATVPVGPPMVTTVDKGPTAPTMVFAGAPTTVAVVKGPPVPAMVFAGAPTTVAMVKGPPTPVILPTEAVKGLTVPTVGLAPPVENERPTRG